MLNGKLFGDNRSYVFFMRQLRLAHFLLSGKIPGWQKLAL